MSWPPRSLSPAQAAEKTLQLAHDLASRLPGTARALRGGLIDLVKARIIAEVTRVLDPEEAAAAEALILAKVAGKTPGQVRVIAARAATSVNPAAAQARRERAQRDARVELWREDAGTAALCGRDLPPAEALAADQRITAYARELKAAGLDGTMDRLRARAFLDLALGICSRPMSPPRHDSRAAGRHEDAPTDQPRRTTHPPTSRRRSTQPRATQPGITRPKATRSGTSGQMTAQCGGPSTGRRLGRGWHPGRRDQPDHPAGDPARLGRTPRGGGWTRRDRSGPGPGTRPQGRRQPPDHLVRHGYGP